MSSSISNTASQQPFFQPVAKTTKPEAAEKTATPAAGATPNPAVTSAAKNANESAATRNSDGTYGPRHTTAAPYNPLKATKAAEPVEAASETGVNIKI